MAWFDKYVDQFAAAIAGYMQDPRQVMMYLGRQYYAGNQKPQLKVEAGKYDDNIQQNFVGLAVDRSVSRLLRGGVEFELPEGTDEQGEYLERLWDLNKKQILLFQLGLHGAIYGTPYVKIVPDGRVDPYTGEAYPRLIALDCEIVKIVCDPQDMEQVQQYIIEYSIKDKGSDVFYREVTRKDGAVWLVENFENRSGMGGTNGQWQLVGSVTWPYDFAPIIHWKNLPSVKTPYGSSDIEDIIGLQDKSNLSQSDIAKIIRYHASPTTIATGVSADSIKPVKDADRMWAINSAEAKVFNLEMQSDLVSSNAHAANLRQSIFDLSREVDISSITDKLGALTNFGLHVLYTDATDKNDTKRQLFGDALLELNRRLLVLKGYKGLESDPGAVRWGQGIITDETEDMTTDKTALEIGIIDKQTIAERWEKRYGQDWETIQARLEEQSQKDNATNANIGSILLRNFNRGQGAEQPPKEMPQNMPKETMNQNMGQ